MKKFITTLTKKQTEIIIHSLSHSIQTADWDIKLDKPAAELLNYFIDIKNIK